MLACAKGHADAVTVPVAAAPMRLQTLERKASEYERYRAQFLELQKLLDGMLALLPVEAGGQPPTPQAGYGMLADLLEKAARVDELTREVAVVRSELDRVQKQRDALKREVDAIQAEQAAELEKIKAYRDEIKKWEAKAVGMRETIERLLLGEFEYYEVKEGDTLQSIAANPMVYGDPSRATWLQQVNEGRVKYIHNLSAGEMLLVPRFPANGTYEF